jgi:hypothetical protein
MKKIFASILFFSALLVPAITVAQDKEKFDPARLPMEVNTKLVTYIEVIQVPGVSAKEMYNRGLKWFNTFYKNPTDVIRETDSIKGSIKGKARFKIYNPAEKDGFKKDAGNVEYSITVGCKEGKFRFTITELNWKQVSYYPVEKWMDTTARTYTPLYLHYLEEMDARVKEIIKNLETFMKTSPPIKKDDW